VSDPRKRINALDLEEAKKTENLIAWSSQTCTSGCGKSGVKTRTIYSILPWLF